MSSAERSERWHRSLKNQVLLADYCLPGDLKVRIAECVDYYKRKIKQKTINERRRLKYRQKVA
jgi:hypothetical protein